MNDFVEQYLISSAIAALISTVKNPQTVKRYLAALTKVAAVLTVAIDALGQREAASLDEAILKEQAKLAGPPA